MVKFFGSWWLWDLVYGLSPPEKLSFKTVLNELKGLI